MDRKPVAAVRAHQTHEIAAILEKLNCCPAQGMAKIAMDRRNTPELGGKMFAELAGYLYPRRKAIEVNAPNRGPIKTAEEEIARTEAADRNQAILLTELFLPEEIASAHARLQELESRRASPAAATNLDS